MTLTPLAHRDAKAQVARRVIDTIVQQRIVERAGGHPLFLTQLADFDLDSQAPVPVSVVALVQSELDRLSERSRDACLKASVLGAEFTLTTLESVFPEIDREDLSFVRQLKRQGERMSFDHALIHEAVYALLSPDVQARLHSLAAEYCRSIDPLEYAYHAQRCGDASTAIEACCVAAERLLLDNRHDDAERLVAQGMQLNPTSDQLARLLVSKTHLQRDQGDLDKAVATCQAAYDNAINPGLKVRTLVRSATLLKRRRALDRAAAQLRLASGIAESGPLPPLILAELEHEWGNNMFMRGKASRCLEHHQRARKYAEQANDKRMQADALGGLGDAYYAESKARSAHRCFSDCVRLADANELPLVAIAHRPMAAFTAHLVKPGQHEVFLQLQQSVLEAQRWKSPNYEMLARLAYMEPLLHALKINEADKQLHAMEMLQTRIGGDRFVPDQLYGRILWHWAQDEEEKARQLAIDGVERFGKETYMGPSFHAALAALCNDDATADRSLAAGEALLRQGSMLHNHVGYAELASACHWRRGQPERAIHCAQSAQDKFAAEPVGLLQACLEWMQSGKSLDTLERQGVSLFSVTHAQRFAPQSANMTH